MSHFWGWSGWIPVQFTCLCLKMRLKMPISWHGHCVLLPLDWTIKLRVPLKYSGTKPYMYSYHPYPWRIHGAAIYGVPWIPSIYPKCRYIYHTWILWDILSHRMPIIAISIYGWPRRKAERRHLRCCSPALWRPWNAPGVSGGKVSMG